MKMYKRKILFTAFFLVGLTLISCLRLGDCPPIEGAYFNITGIGRLNHTDTTGQSLADNFALEFEEYGGLDLEYAFFYYGLLEKSLNHHSEFGQLYALSCFYDGELGSEEKYKSFNVITLYDFNSNYKQGDTINDLMSLPYVSSNESNSYKIFIPETKIFLTEPPTLSSKFKIKVVIELDNGEKYSKESTTVEFI
jgi:hypothetical protein